ncbi:MAG TPA: ROK family transcriptional regulator, partial [Trebonia sp.]
MQPRVRADRVVTRSTRDLVLTALRARGPMSRADLARYTNAAPSTISGVVQELLLAGLVVPSPHQAGTGQDTAHGTGPDTGQDTAHGTARDTAQPGRPGLSLTLNPKLGAVAGIEFCFDELRVLLCDLARNVIGTAKCELPHAHTSDTALAAAARLVGEALAAAGLGRDALIRAGVSVPGPVSRHPDAVTPSAILPGWHGVAADEIADALGVAVSIDNDSNLAALGEHVWGAGRGCDDSVTLKFHYGIGCGLFVNGALVRGCGGAGEIGHIAVDERGPLCRCGKRGCLETYAAISAIMEALRPQHGNLTLAQLMRLLAVRDPGAVRVVGDAAELIGMHLAAVCNLLAPRRVIVTGPMAQAGGLVTEPIRAAVRR